MGVRDAARTGSATIESVSARERRPMARRDSSPDFIEALARGLDVLPRLRAGSPACRWPRWPPPPGWPGPPRGGCCSPWPSSATCASDGAAFALTPRVLELGMAYVGSLGLWDIARPHMERLVARTHESSSIAQLDGIATSSTWPGSRCRRSSHWRSTSAPGSRPCRPRWARSCSPRCRPAEAERVLAEPSRSRRRRPAGGPAGRARRPSCGRSGPAAGRWPTRNSPPGSARWRPRCGTGTGRVLAAMNVTVHAAETSVEV